MEAVSRVPEIRFKADDGSEFPEWEEKRLGEITKEVMYGIGSAATKYDGKNKYLRITDIHETSNKFMPKPLTSPIGPIDSKYVLKENEIVFARTGASVGKSYLYDVRDGRLIFAGFLIKMSILKSEDSRFIFFETLSHKYNKWVKVFSQRSGQPGLNAEEYKSYKINLPSLPEQQKIANFLSTVDQKIETLTRRHELLQQYKKGMMQKLFAQEIRFRQDNGSEFPEWEEKRMKDISTINQGLQIPIANRFYEEGANRWFYITNEFLRSDSEKKYYIENPPSSVLCDEDDILMTRTGNTGKIVTGVVGAFHNNFFKIKYDKSLIKKCFLFYYLNLYSVQCLILRLAGTSTIPDLNHGDFYRIPISFSSLPEQQKIADFLSAIDQKIEAVSTQIDQMKTWKKGLMQKMFV